MYHLQIGDTLVMLAILLIRYLNKKEFAFENSFYFLMVYALFVAMSALFSSHKYWVAHGTYELFEGFTGTDADWFAHDHPECNKEDGK